MSSVSQVEFTGPHSDILTWRHVSDAFEWGSTFASQPFYNARFVWVFQGAKKICGIQFWAAGKGVDCGLHDHSDLTRENTFCEIHFALFNGTGLGGMVWISSEDGRQWRVPLQSGAEHGRFWLTEGSPSRERPRFSSLTGGVQYVQHKWQAGTSPSQSESFDVWFAMEFPVSTLYGTPP